MKKFKCQTLALLFLLNTLGACEHKEHHAAEAPHFEVTSPVRQNTEVTREFVCQIRAARHIELRALESGYLQDTFADEGQAVHAGQRLFQITPVVYQAEAARSEAEARFADVEYENTRLLREGNVVSPNELALASANREKAAAQRSLAQARLRFATITAPFDGIMGRLHVRRGSLLEDGELLTELSDLSEMWVYFNVSEADYLAYRRTHAPNEAVPVRLRMANGQVFDQPGTIQTIVADFNSETGTIAFRAGFANPNGLLRHGETGTILMTRSIENALLLPQKATFDVLDKKFVFVVDEHDVVRAREITVAESLPHLYVVASGLAESDRVLLDGLRRVRDGDHIVPTVRPMSEVVPALNVPAQ